MWAEAVYRRFDGDVGWVIRSNFKHVTRSMWHSYIRGKDHASMDANVKLTVKSSLVRRVLSDKNREFTGQFATRVRRFFKSTVISKPEMLSSAVSNFCKDEIEDIKTTAWGYCLLMSRNQHKAKCSENGEPKRYRANPSLCLGCQNYLAQKSSFEYVLFHIAKDIEIVNSLDTPMIYRDASCHTIKYASSLLRRMAPDSPVLSKIDLAIENHARKLKTKVSECL